MRVELATNRQAHRTTLYTLRSLRVAYNCDTINDLYAAGSSAKNGHEYLAWRLGENQA